MSDTVLFGKVKDPELMVFNFRGQLQGRMGGNREGPIEVYPKFWSSNPLAGDKQEILRIPAWKGSFDLVKRELEMILEREVLPTAVPEFPIIGRMTLGMNIPLVVASLHARAKVEKQQKEFTDSWDPLFIGFSTALFFHTCDIKINLWTTQAKKMRGSMPPKFEVHDILRTLEQARLENMLPVWDDGRMIVEEGYVALKDEMKFVPRVGAIRDEARRKGAKCSRRLLCSPHGVQKAGPSNTITPIVGTPGDKRSGPVENRFRDALERKRAESEEGESVDEAGEEMRVGNTPEQNPAERDFTTQKLLHDLSGED